MKALILSAGFGTRLLPLTNDLPKALIRYKESPMINYQIERLKNAGFTELTVNAHHHYEKIISYFSENDFGIKINVFEKIITDLLAFIILFFCQITLAAMYPFKY